MYYLNNYKLKDISMTCNEDFIYFIEYEPVIVCEEDRYTLNV